LTVGVVLKDTPAGEPVYTAVGPDDAVLCLVGRALGQAAAHLGLDAWPILGVDTLGPIAITCTRGQSSEIGNMVVIPKSED
jgi:hypothetical protein